MNTQEEGKDRNTREDGGKEGGSARRPSGGNNKENAEQNKNNNNASRKRVKLERPNQYVGDVRLGTIKHGRVCNAALLDW